MAYPKQVAKEGGWAELIHLAWPFIVSNSIWTLQLLLDRVLLARYGASHEPHTFEVGAAMAAGVFFWVPMSLAQGTAGYVTTFVAQYVGAGQFRRIGPVIWQALYFSIIAGLLTLLLVPLAEPLVALGGHSPHMQELETTFLQCIAGAVMPGALTATVCGFFAGRGASRTVLFINAYGMIVYGVFASLLIFGNESLHIPDSGIAGAARASVIGNWNSALLGLILLFRAEFEEAYAMVSGWRFDYDLFRRLMRFGLPNGLGAALDPIVFTFFTWSVGRIGDVALAATSVTFSLNLLLILPALGIGQAVEVLVGKRIGESRPDVAARSTWTAFLMVLVFTACAAAMFLVEPAALVAIFGATEGQSGDGGDIAVLVPILLRFVAVYCLFDTMNIVFSYALRGAGDTRFVTLCVLVFAWPVMVIPTWLVVGPDRGLYWAWTFASAYIIALAMTYLFRFLQGHWRSMRVIEHVPASDSLTASSGAFVSAHVGTGLSERGE
jgi:MATE family multidrug resistance protein